MSFDWQTEEDVRWDDEPLAEPTPPKKPRRWRRWLLVLLVVLVLIGGGAWYAYQQVNERLEEVSQRTEEEILASHNLIQTAVSNSDIDLFISFLSGREPEWAFGAEEAVRKSSFLDRPALGLVWQPMAEGSNNLMVQNVSANLNSAEISYEQQFAIDIGNGLTETVTLDMLDTYRLGPNRWLLAPPEAEFWGDNLVHRGQRLHLNYPDRDKEIGRRLGVDLDEKLQEACNRLPGLNCTSDLRLTVHLTSNPSTLAANFGADVLFYDLDDIRLPTPTLVGLPQDEPGYQVLLRGYSVQLVSALIAASAEWECCRHVHYYQPLLDYQLVQLGLKAWPLTEAHYQLLAEEQPVFTAVQSLWDVDQGKRAVSDLVASYALVEFWQTAVPELSLAQQQAALMRQPNQRLSEWVLAGSNGRFTTDQMLENNFYQFVFEESGLAEANQTPIPVTQQLAAICRTPDSNGLFLFQHDVATNLTTRLTDSGALSAFMIGLQDDSGVVLTEQPLATGASPRTSVWQNGRFSTLTHANFDDIFPLVPLYTDPAGEQLVVRVLNNASAPFAAASLDDCSSGDSCLASALLGLPVWSPMGERSLAVRAIDIDPELGRGLMFIGNSQVSQLDFLADAAAPFWVDDETFGYVVNGQTVYTSSADVRLLEAILTTTDLVSGLVAADHPNTRTGTIDFVQSYPNDPDLLLIATADPSGNIGETYLFSYRLSTREIALQQVRPEERRETRRTYRRSPSGRWLAIGSFNGSSWRLHLYDLVNNQVQLLLDNADLPFPADRYIDWSADESWLTVPDHDLIRLLLLDGSGYERPLFITDQGCETAVWIDPES
ncbi:MAG: hypothetical protein AAF614_33045 [Chloroflexota bacterium]